MPPSLDWSSFPDAETMWNESGWFAEPRIPFLGANARQGASWLASIILVMIGNS